MDWESNLKGDVLSWLLEPDQENPGVRYFALRDVLDLPIDDPDVIAAQAEVMRTGPVPVILDAQYPQGYWVKPEPFYTPKYKSTLWQVLILAQLGADPGDERVHRAVEYLLTQAQAKTGVLSYTGKPSGALHCMWGNLVRALLDLGFWGDERLDVAIDLLARSVTGDGYPRYYRSGVQGPGFPCSANDGQPCGWGAVRVLWGLSRIPVERRPPQVEAAIEATIDFLLSYDVARADYPYRERISSSWFKLGYPVATYVSDVLLNLEALAEAGCGGDPRLDEAIAWVVDQQDEQGRWAMMYSLNGKMWVDIEEKRQPSKWVTLRAARMLKWMNQ